MGAAAKPLQGVVAEAQRTEPRERSAGEAAVIELHPSAERVEIVLKGGADNLRFARISEPVKVIVDCAPGEWVFEIVESSLGKFSVRDLSGAFGPVHVEDDPIYLEDGRQVRGMVRLFDGELVIVSTSSEALPVQARTEDISRFPRNGIGPQPRMRSIA